MRESRSSATLLLLLLDKGPFQTALRTPGFGYRVSPFLVAMSIETGKQSLYEKNFHKSIKRLAIHENLFYLGRVPVPCRSPLNQEEYHEDHSNFCTNRRRRRAAGARLRRLSAGRGHPALRHRGRAAQPRPAGGHLRPRHHHSAPHVRGPVHVRRELRTPAAARFRERRSGRTARPSPSTCART